MTRLGVSVGVQVILLPSRLAGAPDTAADPIRLSDVDNRLRRVR